VPKTLKKSVLHIIKKYIGKQNRTSAIILVLLILIVFIFQWWQNKPQASISNDPASTEIDGLNRHPQRLIYTKHAKCRMGCRHFTKSEVVDILENGKINRRKTNLRDQPCPSYALEGVTADGQHARMVFAACGMREVKVVTCIDLDRYYKCDCN